MRMRMFKRCILPSSPDFLICAVLETVLQSEDDNRAGYHGMSLVLEVVLVGFVLANEMQEEDDANMEEKEDRPHPHAKAENVIVAASKARSQHLGDEEMGERGVERVLVSVRSRGPLVRTQHLEISIDFTYRGM